MAYEYFTGKNGLALAIATANPKDNRIFAHTLNFAKTVHDVEGIYLSEQDFRDWTSNNKQVVGERDGFLGWRISSVPTSSFELGEVVEVKDINGFRAIKIDIQSVQYPTQGYRLRDMFAEMHNSRWQNARYIWSFAGSSIRFTPYGDNYFWFGKDAIPSIKSRSNLKNRIIYPVFHNFETTTMTLYSYSGSKIELTPKTNVQIITFKNKILNHYLGRYVSTIGDFHLFKLENPDLLNYLYEVFPNSNVVREIDSTREQLELKISINDNNWKMCAIESAYTGFSEFNTTARVEDLNKKLEEIDTKAKDNYEQDASAEDKGNQMLEVVAKGYHPIAVVKFEKTDLFFKNDEIIGTFDTKKLAETRGSHKVIGYTDPTVYFSNEVKVPLYLSEISLEELKKELGASKKARLENENNVVWVKIKDVAWYGADVNLNGEWIIHTELPENLPFKEEVEVAPSDAPAENRKEKTEQKDNKLLWLAIAAGTLILMK